MAEIKFERKSGKFTENTGERKFADEESDLKTNAVAGRVSEPCKPVLIHRKK